MINLTITENQGNQRLDRFLKKYFDGAPLSRIYKMIRKDIKINGRRGKEDTLLLPGDQLTLYITESEAASMQKPKKIIRVKRQFKIAYEDENIIVVEKPFGLLTHGDRTEKKNHLANQVIDYLIETGAYQPRLDKTFSPAPANRLDRNTTGLVVFGKNAAALQELNPDDPSKGCSQETVHDHCFRQLERKSNPACSNDQRREKEPGACVLRGTRRKR